MIIIVQNFISASQLLPITFMKWVFLTMRGIQHVSF